MNYSIGLFESPPHAGTPTREGVLKKHDIYIKPKSYKFKLWYQSLMKFESLFVYLKVHKQLCWVCLTLHSMRVRPHVRESVIKETQYSYQTQILQARAFRRVDRLTVVLC